jgi:hypothetical protein
MHQPRWILRSTGIERLCAKYMDNSVAGSVPFTWVVVSTNCTPGAASVYIGNLGDRFEMQGAESTGVLIYDGVAAQVFYAGAIDEFFQSVVTFSGSGVGTGSYNGTSAAFSYTAAASVTGLRIGALQVAENEYYVRGPIGETMVFSSALSDADRKLVEGYCAHKWGLQALLPSDHPYKNTVFEP